MFPGQLDFTRQFLNADDAKTEIAKTRTKHIRGLKTSMGGLFSKAKFPDQ